MSDPHNVPCLDLFGSLQANAPPLSPQDYLYGYAYNSALFRSLLAFLAGPDEIVLVFESAKSRKVAADTS